jgi:hypothetical protein
VLVYILAIVVCIDTAKLFYNHTYVYNKYK